ncbi:MAG: AAA family ATPase [Planctomycetaceae bacterium]|nr:AAA family ATPase [Planctomycetaceae bacterium]
MIRSNKRHLNTRGDESLPQDVEAERGLIGCLLNGATDTRFDAELCFHSGRRLLAQTIHILWSQGVLQRPAEETAAGRNEAVKANLELVAAAVTSMEAWPVLGTDARHELRECTEVCTLPIMIDRFIDRLLEEDGRRRLINSGQQLLRDAQDRTRSPDEIVAELDLPAGSSRTACRRERPNLRKMQDVVAKPVDWLWPTWMAAGKLNIVSGDPGLGKSLLTMDLAARLSVGGSWPDGRPIGQPGGTVLLTVEDDPDDTIRPRLDAAGADVSRINLLQSIVIAGSRQKERSVCLTTDLSHLETAIRETPNCRLVIIDPVTSYLGNTDSHKNADVRSVLDPLAMLASRLGVAILLVTHLNKSGNVSAIQRTSGSMAFVAVARAAYLVDADPKVDGARLMLPIKNNLEIDSRGMRYAVCSKGNGLPYLEWSKDPVRMKAQDLFTSTKQPTRRGSKVKAAMEWLKSTLANGPLKVSVLRTEATAAKIAEKTLQRAKVKLKVVVKKLDFEDGWEWSLPSC